MSAFDTCPRIALRDNDNLITWQPGETFFKQFYISFKQNILRWREPFKTLEAYRYFVIVLKLLIENHWILTSHSRQTPQQAASEVILRQVARQVVVRVLGEHVGEPLLGLRGPAPRPAHCPAHCPAPDVLEGALVSVHLVVELVVGGAGGLLGAERVGAELQGLVLVPALLDVVAQGRAAAHQLEDARGYELRARNEIGKPNQIDIKFVVERMLGLKYLRIIFPVTSLCAW